MKTRLVLFIFVLALIFPFTVAAQFAKQFAKQTMPRTVAVGEEVEIVSGDLTYPSYLSTPVAPDSGEILPAVVLIHSFNGLEEGYRTMTDLLAEEGFVVLAVGWQTHEQSPTDDTMSQLLADSAAYLSTRPDVDPARIGLTGFCAGGRATMLFLPQLDDVFAAGVAWYGFPDRGEPAAIDLVGDLDSPMLMIHGTADDPSPIAGIYDYASALDSAGAYFELKVYQGEPHGFMLAGGQMRTDPTALDAFNEMLRFFQRNL